MNIMQRIILLIGMVIVTLTILFPVYNIKQHKIGKWHNRTYMGESVNTGNKPEPTDSIMFEWSEFHFIFSPPISKYEREIGNDVFYSKTNYIRIEKNKDLNITFLLIGLEFIVAVMLFFLVKTNKKTN